MYREASAVKNDPKLDSLKCLEYIEICRQGLLADEFHSPRDWTKLSSIKVVIRAVSVRQYAVLACCIWRHTVVVTVTVEDGFELPQSSTPQQLKR